MLVVIYKWNVLHPGSHIVFFLLPFVSQFLHLLVNTYGGHFVPSCTRVQVCMAFLNDMHFLPSIIVHIVLIYKMFYSIYLPFVCSIFRTVFLVSYLVPYLHINSNGRDRDEDF